MEDLIAVFDEEVSQKAEEAVGFCEFMDLVGDNFSSFSEAYEEYSNSPDNMEEYVRENTQGNNEFISNEFNPHDTSVIGG